MESVYVIYFKDKPIHKEQFYFTDRNGKIQSRKIGKKIYTTKGYANGAIIQMPEFIDREYLNIVEYKRVR